MENGFETLYCVRPNQHLLNEAGADDKTQRSAVLQLRKHLIRQLAR